jgi:hypothetical protein
MSIFLFPSPAPVEFLDLASCPLYLVAHEEMVQKTAGMSIFIHVRNYDDDIFINSASVTCHDSTQGILWTVPIWFAALTKKFSSIFEMAKISPVRVDFAFLTKLKGATEDRDAQEYRDLINFLGPVSSFQLLEKLNDAIYLNAHNVSPNWFDPIDHDCLLNPEDDIFVEWEDRVSIYFLQSDKVERGLVAENLVREVVFIERGRPGARTFEVWCRDAIACLFGHSLSPIYLHPNANAVEQRDFVGVNEPTSPFWRRILRAYNSQYVCFEIKNFDDLRISEYRQIYSYISEPHYGDFGFLISRSNEVTPTAHECIEFRKVHNKSPRKVIINMSCGFLSALLWRIRCGFELQEIDSTMSGYLDYHLLQLSNEPRV